MLGHQTASATSDLMTSFFDMGCLTQMGRHWLVRSGQHRHDDVIHHCVS